MLLHKLDDFGQAPAYIPWFHSYITYRGALSTPYAVLSGVPHGSALGPLLFADYIKIYREIKSAYDGWSLQSDVNNIRMWCVSNYMKLSANKTNHFLL